jgi:hypothetical protein
MAFSGGIEANQAIPHLKRPTHEEIPQRFDVTLSVANALKATNVHAGQVLEVRVIAHRTPPPEFGRAIIRCECVVADEDEPYTTVIDTGRQAIHWRLHP